MSLVEIKQISINLTMDETDSVLFALSIGIEEIRKSDPNSDLYWELKDIYDGIKKVKDIW